MPPRSPFPVFGTNADSRAALLQGLLIAAVVVAALHFGRDLLLPLTFAILLSFVLSPPLLWLRRLRVPRVLSVLVVVIFAFTIIGSLGWIMSQQIAGLAEDLPRYQTILAEKMSDLREGLTASPALKKASDVMERLEEELDSPAPGPSASASSDLAEQAAEVRKPIAVEIHEPQAEPFEFYRELLGTLLPPLAIIGIIILFVVFILLQREDLRDRMIRLAGVSDLQRTTSAMNEAATRLSGYFLRQVLINFTYGVFITTALWLLGMPTPIVWGILAMLMRFVPYIGSYLAALPALLLAAVIDPGWTTFLIVLVIYVGGEFIVGQAVEPLVYGHGTGLSPIAVIFSAVFWAWLWGPLGLLIAMPLTVCLAVLGRHVEGLSFLEVLLGDEPAFTPVQSFYQRVLTGDSVEATYQAKLCLKEGTPLVDYLDDVALKGLQLAERDAKRGSLGPENLQEIEATVEDIMDNLAGFEPRRWFGRLRAETKEAPGALTELSAPSARRKKNEELPSLQADELAPAFRAEDSILCIGGRNPLDGAAASMLAAVLKRHGLRARAMEQDEDIAGQVVPPEVSKARLVCLSYLDLDGSSAHMRDLVRRLRRILPEGATVLVGLWDGEADENEFKAIEKIAVADAYASNLRQAAATCIAAASGAGAKKSEKAKREKRPAPVA